MKRMSKIIGRLNSMTEQEKIEYIKNELSLEDVFALYDEFGFVTEIGNGTVQTAYLEGDSSRIAIA